MIRNFFKFLLLGALHKQRGDHTNIYLSRAIFWVSLSTSLYLTSLAHYLIPDQFIAFSKLESDSLFSYKSFDGSYLMAGLLTIGLMIAFFFVYGLPLIDEFKESKKRGMRYRVFLLYFLLSIITFVFTMGFVRPGY
ncbi:hypothetical protein [Roseivirga misakiensis]|uniref:Uncharacterized protein n=1 Tax=Roseivirga misakiensis TaxID=1563681 RepID=A0A1E5T4W7_9BACT|nr:hypothetical protein [Roseivirga misakiensis]OEK06357.1 hypothetical protein BFP71_01380 [Roseivirga misakiensis]